MTLGDILPDEKPTVEQAKALTDHEDIETVIIEETDEAHGTEFVKAMEVRVPTARRVACRWQGGTWSIRDVS